MKMAALGFPGLSFFIKGGIFIKARNKKIIKNILKGLLAVNCLCIITCTGVGVYGYCKYGDKIKSIVNEGYNIADTITEKSFNTRKPTQFYDKNGDLIKEFTTAEYDYITKEEINPYVFEAFISIEDERFYDHGAIDVQGILRAVMRLVQSKGDVVQGGSTITQQLAKNVFLTTDRTMWRKISEMIIAHDIENKFSKDDILEFYVNNIYFANGCYSVETASQYYFQKTTKELSISEVALLAGIPNNPTYYNPVKNLNNAIDRRNVILGKMLELEKITQTQYDEAIKEKVELNIKPIEVSSENDYALDFAIYNATRELMKNDGFIFRYSFTDNEDRTNYFEEYNEEYAEMQKKLLAGRYVVETSIDKEKQAMLQAQVDQVLSKYTDTNDDTGLYKKQASSVLIDNETGEVQAIVGGRTQDGNTFNRAYLGVRQPGSTIKPLVAYTPAFEGKYIPSSTYNDAPIPNGPQNDDYSYRGQVSLKYAVDISINTIPFRLIQNDVQGSLQYLKNMEFKYITPDDNTSIVALGGFTKGTTVVEMASGYSTLARNGEFISPTNVRKITDQVLDQTVYENKHESTKVYDSGASYLMVDVLKSVLSEPYSTGYKVAMNNYPYQMGKTGTTDKSKDCWFVGSTPYYSCAVWVGDDIPAPQNMFGANEPGTIWKGFMEQIHEGLDVIDFERPSSIIEENGVLKNTMYLAENNRKERLREEQSRIKVENQKNIERIEAEEYRIKYGLSKKQEEENERLAERYIDELRGYKLIDKEQYDELNQLIDNTYKAIDDVKRKSKNIYYSDLLNTMINYFNEVKKTLEAPPVPIIEDITEENETEINNDITIDEKPNNIVIEDKPNEEETPHNEEIIQGKPDKEDDELTDNKEDLDNNENIHNEEEINDSSIEEDTIKDEEVEKENN